MLPALLLGGARRGAQAALQPGALTALVSTTSEALNAAAAPAAASTSAAAPRVVLAKPPLYKEFQIYRWNPDAGDDKPKYAAYQVDINNCGPMMLDVLLKVKDEQDQGLSLRRSCRCEVTATALTNRRQRPGGWPGAYLIVAGCS